MTDIEVELSNLRAERDRINAFLDAAVLTYVEEMTQLQNLDAVCDAIDALEEIQIEEEVAGWVLRNIL